MKKILSLILVAGIYSSADAAVVINLFAGELRTSEGNLLPAGSLLQLVNLGLDGVFNTIDLTDGSTAALTQWVSGDDSLINVPFLGGTSGVSGGTNAFAMPDGTGILNAGLEIEVAAGTKIGLRWFSGIQATAFSAKILGVSDSYGQYTLQGVAEGGGLHGGNSWIAPAPGGTVNFDSLATQSIGGLVPNTEAQASIVPVPEPTSAFLVAVGAAGLMMRRRRQS
jgi:hypothetical protein